MGIPELSTTKDILDWVVDVVTVAALPGALIAYVMARRESKNRAATAIEQIDTLSTNHIPHLQAALNSANEKLDKANTSLESIDRGIAILVDRKR